MNHKQFVEEFNKANLKQRAAMIVENEMKEPDINLIIPTPEGSPYLSFNFNGYTWLRVGIWYVVKHDARIVLGAFCLHPEGVKTFKEWALQCPNNPLCQVFKKAFVKAFDGAVLPEHFQN